MATLRMIRPRDRLVLEQFKGFLKTPGPPRGEPVPASTRDSHDESHERRRFEEPTMASSMRLVAVSAALIVAAYGMLNPPKQAMLAWDEIVVSTQHVERERTAGDAGRAASTAPRSRSVASDARTPRIDDSRECAPDRGINDECIFN
ncbi:MAG TPA: hypothetical protein VFQ55_06775 [Casimicrobiaceae bacterium]|nr:hypothetical protein [Casimicrobiaceae bacterium]